MAVVLDIIDGHTGRKTSWGWEEIERIAKVSGVTGSGHSRIIEAAETSGMPRMGDSYPGLKGCYLYEIRPIPDASDIIKFSLLYKMIFDYDIVEVGATLSQVETNMDVYGALISVSYTYPATYGKEGSDDRLNIAGTTDVTGKALAKYLPDHRISVHKLELVNPSAKALDYVGYVNSGPWSLAPTSIMGQWMCTGLTGTSSIGRVGWDVNYTFQYRPDTWMEQVYYIDPRRGEPPADLVKNVGYKNITLYPIANFNLLGL